VNGNIITRVGDTVVLAVATTMAGKANDPSAGLVSRPSSSHGCRPSNPIRRTRRVGS